MGAVTPAMARFADELVAMEPDTVIAGIHVDKPGYHGTRAENERRDKKLKRTDYSRRHPLDLMGPDDKAAAVDWTHRAAQRGDYRSMAKYGDRLEAAHKARDPRLTGWREAQGQTDTDATPEELNFAADGWTRGTPSASHAWHWHFSEHRAYVESWVNKECMLSILRGESLADYRKRGGQLVSADGSYPDGEDENMFCAHGDEGPRVEAMQRLGLAAGGRLPRFGADGDYGDETAAMLAALTGGDGRTYGPAQHVALAVALAKTHAGLGEAGPAGPPGPKGDAAVIEAGTTLVVQ